MKKTSSTDTKRIMTAFFAEEFPPELKEKLRGWYASPHNRQHKDAVLEEVWNERVHCDPHPDRYAYESLEEIRRILDFPSAKAVRSSLFGRKLFRIAAALLPVLLLSGAFFYLLHHQRSEEETSLAVLAAVVTWIKAGEGKRQHVVLPDGSQVWLNRGARISYPENFDYSRIVRLQGEAFFSIVEQGGDAFRVETDGISVRVRGTEFNVKSNPQKQLAEVTLKSGIVEVATPGHQVMLQPMEQLVCDLRSGEFGIREVCESELAPWLTAGLNFENATLEEVFLTIGHFFDVAVHIDGPLSPEAKINVCFDEQQTLGRILQVIRMVSDSFDYEMQEEKVTIRTR